MRDCLNRGEAPFASHGLYTQDGVLDDSNPTERRQGIEAGFAWREKAELTVVYTDLGISSGMELGIEDARVKGLPIEYRSLKRWSMFKWQFIGASLAYCKIDEVEFTVFPDSSDHEECSWACQVACPFSILASKSGFDTRELAMKYLEDEAEENGLFE